MEYLNLIPIALLVLMFLRAFKGGLERDTTDTYFQVLRIKTGKKFCNLFGIPKP